MPDECPGWFIAAGYLSALTGAFSGIWYLLIRVSICDPCNRSPFEFFSLLLGFVMIFLFSGYMLVRMLFPVRTGPCSSRIEGGPGGETYHHLLCCRVQ